MSEFLAEAQVLIRPNTTSFRAELQTQLAAAVASVGPVAIPVVATAPAAGAAAATQAAAQTAAALEAQGAAARKATAATAGLSRAEKVGAEAAQALALAESEVVGASSELAAAQITLTRSTAAVAKAEQALAAALSAEAPVLITVAEQTLLLARAQQAEATTALEAARAQQAHAATLGAVGTAGVASTASFLGLRGAVLTAGAAFLGATIAFQATIKSIGAASATSEELNKSIKVFGESAEDIREFARTASRSLGISNLEALRAANIFGNLFRSVEIGIPAAAEMSQRLVKLAADLASLNNADPSQVLDNIRSGLAGEAEPLRKFGIFLTEARVQQEALILTGKKQVAQLTQAEKAQARYNLILDDGAIAQDDFANTADSLANSSRTLNAELSDLGAQLGSAVTPGLTNTAIGASNLVRSFQDLIDIAGKLAKPVGDAGEAADRGSGAFSDFRESLAKSLTPGRLFRDTTQALSDALDKLAGNTIESTKALPRLSDELDRAGRVAAATAAAIVRAQRSIQGLGQTLNALEVEALRIQTGLAPGGRAAEEANLRRQIEADKQLIEETKSGTEARRQALLDLKDDQDALAALQKQDAEDAQRRADSVRDASRDAAKARREADEAFIESLSVRREDVQNAIEAAASDATIQQQIRAQNKLQALIKVQIQKIRERRISEDLKAAAIRELRQALNRSRREEDALREQQKQEREARRDEIQQLNIDIAQERGNEAAARRAIQARIKTINAQIKAAKGDQVKVKQLILERERLRNQLEDLNEEQKKTSDISKEVFFDFLQKQQGFAANLLGNLIPGFATAGLVGGQQAGLQQAVTPPSRALSEAAAVTQVQGAGITRGQGDTQLAILRQIRDALFTLTGRTAVPEARYQRATQSAFMDVIGT